jgi:hypothetical protein
VVAAGNSVRNMLPDIQDPVKKFFGAATETKQEIEKSRTKSLKKISQKTQRMTTPAPQVDIAVDKALGLLSPDEVPKMYKTKRIKITNKNRKRNLT